MTRSRRITLALAVGCYVLALAQRPGDVYTDTKIDLYTDPGRFLGEVASAWTDAISLGHVFGGQYGGYLFPMAPWFAAGDALGVPTWIVQRLWLGTILFLAAWGVVKLLDALLERPRGAPHVAAAALYVVNPYVTVYANRVTITLLAYVALPWLLLAVHRGLREPRGWRWPALFALVLTCTGGGVNVAVTAWVLVGPLLFLLYERFYAGVGPGALRPFLVRLVTVTAVANLWWVVPVVVHAGYGLDFLPYTEQPGTIWQTTSVTESLRLVGFWTSYIGSSFGGVVHPYASHGGPLLFWWPVLVASLLVPALALGGFAWTRRWRYGPLFLILALAGLLIMVAGFPEGTPLRRGLTFTYNHVQPVQFLRTTYKAGSLTALGIACLGGAAFGLAWDRFGRLVAAPAVVLVAVAAWPLTTGRAPEKQLVFDVPSWYQRAADQIDALPAGERAMVLPGRLFAYYDWGGTIDPVLPSLAKRPVAERMIIPFSDLRAADLQIATDALISQERLVPGQLPPLLDLLGVGQVLTLADDDRTRSGGPGPVEAGDVLAREPALAKTEGLGPSERERSAGGRLRAAESLPRIVTRSAETGGMVRLLPRDAAASGSGDSGSPPSPAGNSGPDRTTSSSTPPASSSETVVDGGAEGVVALAAFGDLDPSRSLRYAADASPEEIRGADEVVVTDTNRRQAFVSARLKANRGQVLTPAEELSEDGAMMNPFESGGPDAQTVSVLGGVRSLEAPFSPQVTQFPEHRPFAALDGDTSTAWLADRALSLDRHWLEVRLDEPRELGAIDVLPYSDDRGTVTHLVVNGRTVEVHGGWNRIAVPGRVDTVRIQIPGVRKPRKLAAGSGGIRELRIPGVRVHESLRPPVVAERAIGSSFRGGLTYLLSRMTIDDAWRGQEPPGPFQRFQLRDRQDPERVLVRRIAPPVARSWSVDAWTSVPRTTGDDVLDRLAGTTGTVRATSSGRAEGLPSHRASRAFDGDAKTAWLAPWLPTTAIDGSTTAPSAGLTVTLDRPATVKTLQLVPPAETVRRPTRVRVQIGGGANALGGEHAGAANEIFDVDVGAEGTVTLPRAVRARRVTLRILEARFPDRTGGYQRLRRAVGIAELEGLGDARVTDRAGRLNGRCGDAAIRTAKGVIALRPAGTTKDLDAGVPLRATGCGPIDLAAGAQEISGEDGPLSVDQLRLRSGSPRTAPEPAGRVLDPGDERHGGRDDVRVDVNRPAWLVLGEGYNRGWRAQCDGKDLGEPTPLQGFANGWPVEPGCTDVTFAWAPNKLLLPGYLISLIACLALIAVLVTTRGRAAPPPSREEETAVARFAAAGEDGGRGDEDVTRGGGDVAGGDDDVDRAWPLRRALAAGVAAAVVVGFVFALRAGVVAGPAVALVLWRGIGAKRLTLAAAALLGIVVPILYVAVPVKNRGGFNTNLAVERIAAHWVGVAAVVLLILALWRTLARARLRA